VHGVVGQHAVGTAAVGDDLDVVGEGARDDDLRCVISEGTGVKSAGWEKKMTHLAA